MVSAFPCEFPYSRFDSLKSYKCYFVHGNFEVIEKSYLKHQMIAIGARKDFKKNFKQKLFKLHHFQLPHSSEKNLLTRLLIPITAAADDNIRIPSHLRNNSSTSSAFVKIIALTDLPSKRSFKGEDSLQLPTLPIHVKIPANY